MQTPEPGSMAHYNKLLDELLIDLHEWTDYKFNILKKELDVKMDMRKQIRNYRELGIMPINASIPVFFKSKIKYMNGNITEFHKDGSFTFQIKS